MAKPSDKPEKKDESTPAAATPESAPAPAAATAAAQQPPRQQVAMDDTKVNAAYANFCRVTGTPEELILDFGLNPHPYGVPPEPIAVSERIILNYFTAKRMLQVLTMTIQRHEATFGVLETDVQKRVMPGVRAAAGAQRPPSP